jgi:two-component system NtrC family sensor kinase
LSNPAKDTVLIVDDRPANRYTLAHALTRGGYEVIEAETGTRALELAKQMPAAILLDVKLPDILGYEVCRRLKGNPQTSHIPVLQLSAAFVDNESRVYALDSGADAYLTQPVDPNVLVATIRSLVKLHAAEMLAKLSARQWQSTFDALSEGVAVLDEAGRVQRCNRAMTTLLEASYSEIEGKDAGELLGGELQRILSAESELRTLELVWGSRSFRASVEPMFLDQARNGSILVLAEITRQRMAEHAALMNERLATTGRMAHTIAHEINNPLEAITNLLYLLEHAGSSPEDRRAYLASAQEEVARVSRISRQILTFHRESATRIWVDLGDLMDDVLALNNREVTSKELALEKRWEKGIGVQGFPAQLRQVFSNIVRNAIDASDSGGKLRLRISSALLRSRFEGAGVRVTIADSGVGIPQENLARVFDAFFTTKELKGTGVGLWLSSNIVQEHGGYIRIRSRTAPGACGTVVCVVLPVGLLQAI